MPSLVSLEVGYTINPWNTGSRVSRTSNTAVPPASVVTGSANALLTLRVGLIASEYSRALVRPDRSVLRRAATVRAAGMLGSVVAEQAARVTRAILKASGRSVGSVLAGVGSRVKKVASRLPFRERADPEGEGDR